MKSVTEVINSGGVAVIASDTVYGLMAKATDQLAVQRLYGLKSRENKPGTVVAASLDQLVELGIPRRYLTAVGQFWPGPVSVVVPCGQKLSYLHQGKMSLAVRIPKDEQLLDLLVQTGPLLTSSANLPGKPPANTVAEAKTYFGNKVDYYQDGGDLSGRQPSTVLRVIDDAIEVLRQGAVKIENNGEER